jgi:hypothetical protein
MLTPYREFAISTRKPTRTPEGATIFDFADHLRPLKDGVGDAFGKRLHRLWRQKENQTEQRNNNYADAGADVARCKSADQKAAGENGEDRDRPAAQQRPKAIASTTDVASSAACTIRLVHRRDGWASG